MKHKIYLLLILSALLANNSNIFCAEIATGLEESQPMPHAHNLYADLCSKKFQELKTKFNCLFAYFNGFDNGVNLKRFKKIFKTDILTNIVEHQISIDPDLNPRSEKDATIKIAHTKTMTQIKKGREIIIYYLGRAITSPSTSHWLTIYNLFNLLEIFNQIINDKEAEALERYEKEEQIAGSCIIQ